VLKRVQHTIISNVILKKDSRTLTKEYLYSFEPKYGGMISYSLVEEHSFILLGGAYCTNSGAPIVHLFRVSSVMILNSSLHALLWICTSSSRSCNTQQ
jgi:hypothetical protein